MMTTVKINLLWFSVHYIVVYSMWVVDKNNIWDEIKSNHILFVTYTWLADVIASVAKCLCF